ncbi:MAG: MmgE/PrpD family protein [Burkholderiales bacterium]
MTTAAQALAQFAAGLRYEDIPPEVVARARDTIIDTVGVCTFGARMPWSQMVAAYARRYGTGGPCMLIGVPDVRVQAPFAALSNGVFGHAFEQDSLRDPGVGGHPGATLLPAVLAACEERNADGKAALTAFVAGVEVMFRIGLASHHTPEKIGFHAPGLTGPFAAAVAVGRILGLDAERMAHALGVAGSLCSGLLAFTKSKQGAMVKRLHLGRASESGLLAASLAAEGYTGPETILDGKFGFLEAYCEKDGVEPELLTQDLGTRWETLRICMKRYACHVNSHTPVQAVRDLMAEHRFAGGDVERVTVEGAERLLSHHNIPAPGDLMQAQYSVPFCVALALHRDPDDPKSFSESALTDPAITGASRSIVLRKLEPASKNARRTRVTVRLKDGREVARDAETFKGMPSDPLSPSELKRKFMLLTADMGEAQRTALFERLERMENLKRFTLA